MDNDFLELVELINKNYKSIEYHKAEIEYERQGQEHQYCIICQGIVVYHAAVIKGLAGYGKCGKGSPVGHEYAVINNMCLEKQYKE